MTAVHLLERFRDRVPWKPRFALAVLPPVGLFALAPTGNEFKGSYLILAAIALAVAGRRAALVAALEGWLFNLLSIYLLHRGLVVGAGQAVVLSATFAVVIGAIFALDHARRQARADVAWYRSLFDTPAVGISICDSELRALSGNRRLAELLGYDDPAEIVGLAAADVTDSVRPRTELRADLDRLVVERRLRRKDGSPIWLRMSIAAIPGTGNYLSVVEDIEETKAAQEQLREASTLLQRAQQVGGVGTWVWDPASNRTTWSEEARETYAIPADDAATGDPDLFWSRVHPDDRLAVERAQEEAFGAGEICDVEHRIVLPDGAIRWIRARSGAEVGEDGALTRLVGAVIDVTASKAAEQELREATALLERAQEVGGVGSWVWYPREDREVFSEQARRIFGLDDDAASPHDFYAVVHPDDLERLRALTWDSFDTETPSEVEFRIVRRTDGEVRWVREQAVVELDEHGGPLRVLGAVADITERRRAEVELREMTADLVRAQELGRIGSWAWYPQEGRNVWSDEARRIYGFTDEQIAAGDPDLFFNCVHPDDRDDVVRSAWEAFRSGYSSAVDHRVVHPNGTVRWVRGQGDVERGPDGTPYRMVGVVIDVTDQYEANRELERLAFHDPLTGLTNRTSFQRRLEVAVERAKRSGSSVAVLYIDLDDFKLVNDSFGHQAGDELLRETAARLRRRTRAGDLIGRQGGDEFLVLLHETDAAGAERVAASLLETLKQPFAVLGAEVHLSASIGISIFPLDAHSSLELAQHADTAMYAAKQSGRNNAKMYARDGDSALEQLSLTTSLHRALERDELLLHFQPVFDLASGAMVSVEALLRWNHPQRGLILPGEFIPVAERNGLIAPISNWVAREACRHAALWSAQGLDLPVAFNLPPALWQPGLMRHLLSTMEEFGLPADRVIVEITESALSEDLGRQEPLVERLREAGLRLAIDDFGTGHSSLSRLVQLPVSTLKIDSSFIRDIPAAPAAATLVSSIIQLAQSLGLEPLAEGIETEEQHAFLVSRGCASGQGFLLCPPIAASEVPAVYRDAGRGREEAA
jgi:diguanylate cyclase (GGDEF)-like protein/PAS domain S-box-containing protein